jgi:hypothetical protein
MASDPEHDERWRTLPSAATARSGSLAEVILIPKPLRMEWTDCLMLDEMLSHVGVRVGGIIGAHLNRRTAESFIAQATIAGVLGVSERTVWGAIAELERSGYLIVMRRAPGADARRASGGRGVAHIYLPALDKSQISATYRTEKLANRCELFWGNNPQNRVRKPATGCDPTLNLPSVGNNPARVHAREGNHLGVEGQQLRVLIGNSFSQYFGDVQVVSIEGSTLKLSAPTRFIRAWIRDHYCEAIVSAWRSLHPQVERVEVTVR